MDPGCRVRRDARARRGQTNMCCLVEGLRLPRPSLIASVGVQPGTDGRAAGAAPPAIRNAAQTGPHRAHPLPYTPHHNGCRRAMRAAVAEPQPSRLRRPSALPAVAWGAAAAWATSATAAAAACSTADDIRPGALPLRWRGGGRCQRRGRGAGASPTARSCPESAIADAADVRPRLG